MSTVKTGLEPSDYRSALVVQDAVNLSGVVHSFSAILTKLWGQARKEGKGTQWVNDHPISIMFSSKIASLTGCDTGKRFSDAYDACKKGAEA